MGLMTTLRGLYDSNHHDDAALGIDLPKAVLYLAECI